MANMIDRLVSEFSADRARLEHVEVPELGADVRFYFRPAWTLGERDEVYRARAGQFELAVDTIIVKACDEHGQPLFDRSPATRNQLLRQVRPAIVERISGAMLATVMPSDEEEAKADAEALEKN